MEYRIDFTRLILLCCVLYYIMFKKHKITNSHNTIFVQISQQSEQLLFLDFKLSMKSKITGKN